MNYLISKMDKDLKYINKIRKLCAWHKLLVAYFMLIANFIKYNDIQSIKNLQYSFNLIFQKNIAALFQATDKKIETFCKYVLSYRL